VGAAVLGGTCLNDGCIPSKAFVARLGAVRPGQELRWTGRALTCFRRHVLAAHALPTMQQAADAAAIMRRPRKESRYGLGAFEIGCWRQNSRYGAVRRCYRPVRI
jgi:hypothetical protein